MDSNENVYQNPKMDIFSYQIDTNVFTYPCELIKIVHGTQKADWVIEAQRDDVESAAATAVYSVSDKVKKETVQKQQLVVVLI